MLPASLYIAFDCSFCRSLIFNEGNFPANFTTQIPDVNMSRKPSIHPTLLLIHPITASCCLPLVSRQVSIRHSGAAGRPAQPKLLSAALCLAAPAADCGGAGGLSGVAASLVCGRSLPKAPPRGCSGVLLSPFPAPPPTLPHQTSTPPPHPYIGQLTP